MGKNMLFSLSFALKGVCLPPLRGNNSCKTNNFRIKVGNVEMVYCMFWIYRL